MGRTLEAARAQPDHAGAWVDGPVLNLAFTGDLPRHEAEARRTWGGPVCVVQHERGLAELQRISDELWERTDLEVFSTAVLEVENAVEVGVVAVTQEQQRALDERYGKGAVRVQPGLRELS